MRTREALYRDINVYGMTFNEFMSDFHTQKSLRCRSVTGQSFDQLAKGLAQ